MLHSGDGGAGDGGGSRQGLNNHQDSSSQLKDAAKRLLDRIPPYPPIDVLSYGLLREELTSHLAIDYAGIAALDPHFAGDDQKFESDTPNVKNVIQMLASVQVPPELEEWRGKNVINDGPYSSVSQALHSVAVEPSADVSMEAANETADHAVMEQRPADIEPNDDKPEQEMNAVNSDVPPLPTVNTLAKPAVQSDDESVKSCGSVHSAAGRIKFIIRRPVVKSSLGFDRNSLGGSVQGGLPVFIERLFKNDEQLEKEHVLAVQEAVESGMICEYTQLVFGYITRWNSENILAVSVALRCIAVFLDNKDHSVILLFDLSHFLSVIQGSIFGFNGKDHLLDYKHIFLDLICIVAKGLLNDTVTSAYLHGLFKLVINMKMKKNQHFLQQIIDLVSCCFKNTSDGLKDRCIIDMLECANSLNHQLSLRIVCKCLTGMGAGDAKLQLLNSLTRTIADFLWTRMVDNQQFSGDYKETISLLMIRTAVSMQSKEMYPCFAISQHLVPLSVKYLNGSGDIAVKCRLVEYLGKVIEGLSHGLNLSDQTVFTSEWCALFEQWMGGVAVENHEAFIRESLLFKNKAKLYGFLLSLTGHDAVQIRLKVIRVLSVIDMSEPDLKKALIDALYARLSDSSPAVRDAVLDSMLRFIDSSFDNVKFIRLVCSKLTDPSSSVQKRALFLLRAVLKTRQTKMNSLIVPSLLERMVQPSDSLSEMCYLALRDDWFIPGLLADHQSLEDFILSNSCNQEIFKSLLDRMFVDNQIENEHVSLNGFLSATVDKIMDRIIQAMAHSDQEEQIGSLLLAMATLAGAKNFAFLEGHLALLLHFADPSHITNSNNNSNRQRTVQAALSLLAKCLPQVSLASIRSLPNLQDLLTNTILTGNEAAVQSAIDCLYIYSSRVHGNFDLILRLWSKFTKYLKLQLEAPNGSSSSYSRALFSLGMLCRHSASDDLLNMEQVPVHVWNAVKLFMAWFTCVDKDVSVRQYAFQSIMMAVESVPRLFLDDLVHGLFVNVKEDAYCVGLVLNGLLNVLQRRKDVKSETSSFDPLAANRHCIDPLTSDLLQRYFSLVLDCTLLDDERCQTLSARLLFTILSLGSTNPFLIVPVLIGFSASRNQQVRREAERSLDYLIEKHPSLLYPQFNTAMEKCFIFARKESWHWQDDDSSPMGPLSMFYEKTAVVVRKRSVDFATALARLICEVQSIDYLIFLVKSCSMISFRLITEVQRLKKALSQTTTLLAEDIFDVSDPGEDGVKRFILLYLLDDHLRRVYGASDTTKDMKKTTASILKQKARPIDLPDVQKMTLEEAIQLANRLIDDSTIEPAVNNLDDEIGEGNDDRQEPLKVHQHRNVNKNKKQFKVTKPTKKKMKAKNTKKEPKIRQSINVQAISSPLRKSTRSRQKCDYFESSDDDE